MSKHPLFLKIGVLFGILVVSHINISAIESKIDQKNHLAKEGSSGYNLKGYFSEESNSKNLEELGIQLHPGSKVQSNSKISSRSLNHCKTLIYRTLKSLPVAHVKNLQQLTLDFSQEGRRGLGGGFQIKLKCNLPDRELVGVLVHEIGHVVDTGMLQGDQNVQKSEFKDGNSPIYKNDPSVNFYRISYLNETIIKKERIEADFVSGYAMTDIFEDFAETYAYYILHGRQFRELAKHNKVLYKKYSYFKNKIFQGKEYSNGDEENKIDIWKRHYDVTILPYDLKKFFVL